MDWQVRDIVVELIAVTISAIRQTRIPSRVACSRRAAWGGGQNLRVALAHHLLRFAQFLRDGEHGRLRALLLEREHDLVQSHCV